VDAEFSKKPQAWDIKLIQKFMVFIGPMSSIFDYATFALMWWFFGCSAYLTDHNPSWVHLFNTGWFVESLLTQTLIVHIIRTNRIPFFQSAASVPMTMMTVLVMVIGVILPYTPLAPALGMVPLPAWFWAFMVLFLVSYSLLTHTVKMAFHRRYGAGIVGGNA
jgi:Mg2+-importing ATPase